MIRVRKKFFSDENLNRILKFLAIVLLVLAIFFMAVQFGDLWTWLLDAVKAVAVPVAIAWLLSLLLFPLIKLLEKKGIGPRGLSLGIVFLIAVAIVGAGFYFLVPMVIREIGDFFTGDFVTITNYITTGMRDDFFLGTDIYDTLAQYLQETDLVNNLLSNFVPNLISSLTNAAGPIVTIISVVPFLLIYYLLDYEMIGERLRGIVPQKHEKDAAELGSRLNQTVGAYLRGQLGLMVAIGAVAIVVYMLIGLKYAVLFGLIVGLTNIIPYFGAIIAAIPPIVYAFVSKAMGVTGPGPITVLGVNVVLQFIEGNIFQPIIMGKAMKIHPLIIIISILFFGSLFGTLGVVFASPIAASVRVFYQFFREIRLRREAHEANEPPKGARESG